MEFTPKNRATVQNMPKLPYAVEEALNRLRVNVSFLGSKVKKIMVISSAPDEGKSFIAMQLCVMLPKDAVWLPESEFTFTVQG